MNYEATAFLFFLESFSYADIICDAYRRHTIVAGISHRMLRSALMNLEVLLDPEVYDWYLLTPRERWEQSCKLWETFLAMGGTLDAEPDSQSPFFDPEAPPSDFGDGRPGLRIIRRC